jgi:twitching motility protein PilT
MGRFLRDPELDRLVIEMNRLVGDGEDGNADGDGATLLTLDGPHLQDVGSDEPLQGLLLEMVRRGASDLLLVPGAPPTLRVDGRLLASTLPPVGETEIEALFTPHLGARARRQLSSDGSADFSLRLAGGDDEEVLGWRLRVNLHRQRGVLAAAIRALPRRVPTLADLNLPEGLGDLVDAAHGLVLVCGPTGAGKSSTLAALVGLINRRHHRHIITIEDPVEYEHHTASSLVEQVEIGSDASSFGSALRAALRRAPDVILVGEMRDLETMATAITAAETGHLILSTLHTPDSAQAVHRVVDVFPAERQAQVRQQLDLSLRAVVCQQLVPRADGRGRLPAVEVLVANYAIRNHIRKGALQHLYNEILVGKGQGMMSIEDSLAQLVRQARVSPEEARGRSTRPDELERILGA